MDYGMALPPRVRAAFEFLDFCTSESHLGIEGEPRDLTAKEAAVRNAALDVLHLYLMGEMDYGDCPPSAVRPEEPPEQADAVHVA